MHLLRILWCRLETFARGSRCCRETMLSLQHHLNIHWRCKKCKFEVLVSQDRTQEVIFGIISPIIFIPRDKALMREKRRRETSRGMKEFLLRDQRQDNPVLFFLHRLRTVASLVLLLDALKGKRGGMRGGNETGQHFRPEPFHPSRERETRSREEEAGKKKQRRRGRKEEEGEARRCKETDGSQVLTGPVFFLTLRSTVFPAAVALTHSWIVAHSPFRFSRVKSKTECESILQS